MKVKQIKNNQLRETSRRVSFACCVYMYAMIICYELNFELMAC